MVTISPFLLRGEEMLQTWLSTTNIQDYKQAENVF